jgi:6-phosphogluconolactonase
LENIAFKIATSIASTLEESVLRKGYATLVVSGGNSPLEIFSHLNQMPISWPKVTIILGDDRMLDPGNTDSNDKLIRENLIINKAGSAKYLSLIDPLVTPSKLNFPFDISLLGMGLDGHFASLFPELLENISLFKIDAPHEIYLSEDSRESKRGVLDQAIGDSSLPVHHLINQNKIKIEFSDVDF